MLSKGVEMFAKGGGLLSKAAPVAGKVLGKALPGLSLLTGGITGALQAEETGRSKTEAGILGALTGDAKTGSMFSKYVGLEEGSTGDKALGVAGAAATGALTGAAIGSVIPVVGTAIGAGIGGLIGGGAELYKWWTEKSPEEVAQTSLKKDSISESLSGSEKLTENIKTQMESGQVIGPQHYIPMVNPTDVESPASNVQPMHLRDVGQTILRDRVSSSGSKMQSDELSRMEDVNYSQLQELEQIKQGITELVALMKPTGNSSSGSSEEPITGSTKNLRIPRQSSKYGRIKYGKPSGNSNRDMINIGK
jgi:hypothetical protein